MGWMCSEAECAAPCRVGSAGCWEDCAGISPNSNPIADEIFGFLRDIPATHTETHTPPTLTRQGQENGLICKKGDICETDWYDFAHDQHETNSTMP